MRARGRRVLLQTATIKREELWQARETQVGKLFPPEKSAGYKLPPKQEIGFAADTAEKTGMSKRAINRAISRAEAIPGDIRAIPPKHEARR